ncbi:MAG: acylphosphatase [Candidatus Eisenbacteria bacterium]|nr:acylphosphatase [Candidatus Eisenbacteria bacterium]
MSQERLEARIRGAVQGVGFRAFVMREARSLDLTGYVKNEYDGSVEVVAEGHREELERLLSKLHTGPRPASVSDVKASWSEPSREFRDFRVEY